MLRKYIYTILLSTLFITGCSSQPVTEEVNLYTARKEHLIRPLLDIFENDTEFSVEFSVPGSDKKDFTIELENDNLRVARKSKKSIEDRTYSRLEFDTKSFEKSFFLPDSVDQSKISSRYENGVLLITIPKKKEIVLQNKKKTITIK